MGQIDSFQLSEQLGIVLNIETQQLLQGASYNGSII